jgi:hypothetical protein
MKSSCLAEPRSAGVPAAEIVGRRRQISAHWTPTERGRRLFLAAARQAELYARIGLGQLAAAGPSNHHPHATPRSSSANTASC